MGKNLKASRNITKDCEDRIMEQKSKFKDLAVGLGKSAKNIFDNAVLSADQNDDGKFDMEDVSAIAESMSSSIKKGAMSLKETADEKARQMELKALQPIFLHDLDSANFLMPKFIRIAERDKRRAESEVCRGSIGYGSDQKGLHIVNIFRDSLDDFGLTFYPDSDSEFYYIDPTDRDRYISLDEYFSYLKVARITELQRIAQDLGAKYFKVTYKEEKVSFTEKAGSAHVKAVGSNAEASHHVEEKKFSAVDIAAENSFPGHMPVKPDLKYMQKDPSIQALVAMRLNETAPLLRQKFMLKMSTSSGLKESDAAKIDAVLKGMKFSGNTTVSSEVQNESRRYLEYEIEF